MQVAKFTTTILILLTAVISQTISAYGAGGSSSGEFLQIPVYSHGSSLSDAWVAVAEGTGALYYNPAGVGRNNVGEVSFTHSELYQDLRLENASAVIPLHNGSGIGVGFTYLGYGSIKGFDLAGNATGDVAAYSAAGYLSYSQRILSDVSLGATLKPVMEKLDSHVARTVTFDLGILAEFGNFTLGAAVANLNGSLKFVEEEVLLPRTIRIGAAYRTPGSSSTISIGAKKASDESISLSSGLDYRYSSKLSFRVGYGSEVRGSSNASDGMSLGVGLDLSVINIDYSYRPSKSIDGVHQFTASYRFGQRSW